MHCASCATWASCLGESEPSLWNCKLTVKIFKYSALPKAIEVLEFFAASLFFDIEGYVSYLAEHFQKNCFLPKISTYDVLVTIRFVNE
jgi:hypothetical protein